MVVLVWIAKWKWPNIWKNRHRGKRKPYPLHWIAIFFLFVFPVTASASYDDAKVKAAFIYRLLYFIEWPGSEQTTATPINICVVGHNPFIQVQSELEQRKFENRPLTIIEKQRKAPLSDCQVVYVSDSEKANFLHILQGLKTKPILTISDINQFARYGGMVGFTSYNNTLRLEINTKALAAAKFEIDQHLLEVALHVY